MQDEGFERRLERLLDGELSPQEVLPPLVNGISTMLKQFEESLEYQPDELVDSLEPTLNAIADEAQRCLDLADKALAGEADRALYLFIKSAHRHLNALLLDFHECSWAYRGPTIFAWVNRVVDAGERFANGEGLNPSLAYFLEQHIEKLTHRLKLRPNPHGQALVAVANQVVGWARGTLSLNRKELENLLTVFIGRAEAAEAFLTEESLSLEQLLGLLQESDSEEEILWCLDTALYELQPIYERVEVACLSSSSRTGEAAEKVLRTLEAIEHSIHEIGDAVRSGDLQDLAEPLFELYDELQEHVEILQRAADTEGTSPCPSCGTPNSLEARRCSQCSRVLAAIVGGDSERLDFTEGQSNQAMEEQNVHRLRTACLGFQQGTLGLEAFQKHVGDLTRLLELAHKHAKLSEQESVSPESSAFRQGVAQIKQALELLAKIEVPGDKSLDSGLEQFLLGVEKLRMAQSGSAQAS